MKKREKPEFDLRVRTRQYALRIIRLFEHLPRTTQAQMIGKQLLRSGTSVGANYREGYRARSKAEFIAKLGISIQELEESIYWLELLTEANILKEAQTAELQDESNQLIAILITLVKKAKAKR